MMTGMASRIGMSCQARNNQIAGKLVIVMSRKQKSLEEKAIKMTTASSQRQKEECLCFKHTKYFSPTSRCLWECKTPFISDNNGS